MKLESAGILIGMRPFSERDSVGVIFTSDFGVMTGMLKGAQAARKNKPLIGQVGLVSWNARLDSQLGVFHWESEKNMAAPLMLDPKLLGVMNSAFSLIATLLPEREKYEKLYVDTIDLLSSLHTPHSTPHTVYLKWEIDLLCELGYALNLTACSGCGKKTDLNYLSPKTGRAVCNDCAAPYLDKLYKLPLTLDVSRRFLEKACDQQGISLPMARKLI